jgi:predicted nuclease of predicted toxin-antitoxin system
MRFLVDECTGTRVAEWLRSEGHEVFSVYDEARGASDAQIIAQANAEDRILITNDRDFGIKVFRDHEPHCGVVFLRLNDERSSNKILVLRHLLENYHDAIADRFVVVTDSKVRFTGGKGK